MTGSSLIYRVLPQEHLRQLDLPGFAGVGHKPHGYAPNHGCAYAVAILTLTKPPFTLKSPEKFRSRVYGVGSPTHVNQSIRSQGIRSMAVEVFTSSLRPMLMMGPSIDSAGWLFPFT